MPRVVPKRIDARHRENDRSNTPALRVQQDMNVHDGAEMFAVADALNAVSRLGPQLAQDKATRQKKQDSKDFEEGALQRQSSALTGDMDAMLLESPNVTDAFRRGYLESEGAVQLSRFKNDLAAGVAKLGPDDDFEAFAQGKVSAFMEENASADPNIRKTLVPGLTRVVEAARGAYQQQSMNEMLDRQQENLFSLAVEGIKDGSLLTTEGRESIYQFAARPEMGALERREVDPMIAQAFEEQLASGTADPAATMAALEAPRPDGTPGLAHNPKYRENLLRAAEAGNRVRTEATHVAEKQRESDLAFKMDDLADRGVLSDRAIEEYAAQVGKGDDAGWQLSWRNRSQQARKRLASESEARKEKRDIWPLLINADPRVNALPREKVQSTIDEGVLDAMDTKDDRKLTAVLRVAEMNGVIPSLLKNQFAKIDPRTPAQFAALVQQYEKIEAGSPTYARRIVDGQGLAKIDAYRRLVRESGLQPEAAIEVLSQSPVDPDQAKRDINFMWGRSDTQKLVPTRIDVPWGVDKVAANPGYVSNWVRRNAETYYATGQFSQEDAVRKAAEVFKEKHAVINGRYVPNVGFKPGFPEAADDFVGRVKDIMVKAKVATEDDAFFIGPTVGTMNREDGKMAVYWAHDGMPVTDPKTGAPLLVDPNVVADEYAKSTAAAVVERIKAEQEKRQHERMTAPGQRGEWHGGARGL